MALEKLGAEVFKPSDSWDGVYGLTNSLWQHIVPDAKDPGIAYMTATDPAYIPHAPYQAFTRADWERNCQYWNTQSYKEVLERHSLWERHDWLNKSPPSSFWSTWCQVSSWSTSPEELLWGGGTYARHPNDFPAEQSQAAWIYDHLRPLGIQPSNFM